MHDVGFFVGLGVGLRVGWRVDGLDVVGLTPPPQAQHAMLAVTPA
jgi:hypothetical protein